MAIIKVYGSYRSPYTRSALLALEEKEASYALAPVGLRDYKAPPHIERHPFGRVPVLEYDDFTLYETQAILRFVDSALSGRPLQPVKPRLAARMNQIIGIVDWYFHPRITCTISFQRLVAPVFGLAVDEAIVARSLPRAEECVREIDRLLGDSEFMAGSSISLADLMLAPHMDALIRTPEGKAIVAEFPRLSAWSKRMSERPSMSKTSWERLQAA